MSRKRSEEIQAMAMELVEIEPMSAEAKARIDEALAALELEPDGNRWQAFRFLQESGGLEGIDVGGHILNKEEAIAQLMAETGCVKSTAQQHVARAARRKRHPDYRPPSPGGRRKGAGSPMFNESQIRAIRSKYEQGASLAALGEEYATDPSNVSRIVNRKTYKWVT